MSDDQRARERKSETFWSPPPESWGPAHRAARALLRPVERFLRVQAASGIVLLVMAVVAMVWANSPWAASYHHLWHTPIRLGLAGFTFERDLHFWINDVLMVIFFFVVGLEIRREIHAGELSDAKRATLPVIAAAGGMVVPAGIYLALNARSPEVLQGWGVPMATDIAFAVGVLALLGRRVPAALRVLLLAIAIIDDIGAILVIALFYSTGITLTGLGIALAGILWLMTFQRVGVRNPLLYVPPAAVVWAGSLHAGIHPTIAGVAVGLLTPVRSWFGAEGFLEEAGRALEEFQHRRKHADSHELLSPLERLGIARREAVAPVVRLESALTPWVAYVIMPLFAFANAGVTLGEVDLGTTTSQTVAWGVGLGLVVGKLVGIVGTSLVSVRLGLCALPRGVNWRGLLLIGLTGGIGFTMALFIANLAFQDPVRLGVAKLAVLMGSLVAGVLGFAVGVFLLPREAVRDAARTPTEAEQSADT